ncbi:MULTISPECIES: hypothetical protein [Streptomyces]|uniref:hypothetical protein n=1 Tax=Streptomyces TaxID=1883 RepID=UPI00198DFB86|nr:MULTISPECIES: hypothetical protein [Streptomyces]GGT71748.1 hypothetical protein GCM10010272_13560 [Streptomyces lateritius]
MKSRRYRRSWYERRLPLPLRGLIVLAAGLGVFLCGQLVVDGYRATMVYREAPVCEGAGQGRGEGCVRTAEGKVTDRATGEHCTSSGTSGGGGTVTAGGTTAGGGMATAGGGVGGAVTAGGVTAGGGGGTTCTRYYRVEVEWPERTEWLSVDSDAYDEVASGDRARLRLWEGEVVRLEVRGHTHTYPTSSESGVGVWLAVAALILATGVWGAVSGRLSGLIAFPNFGWLFVAVGIGWLGSMALFGGHVLVWAFAILWTGFAVFWIVGAWRDG